MPFDWQPTANNVVNGVKRPTDVYKITHFVQDTSFSDRERHRRRL